MDTRTAPAARYALALVAATAAGFAFLATSRAIGRLALDLEYDDVAYAVDAIGRVDALRAGGLGTYVRGLVESPPHAPLATLQASAAFALAGGPSPLALYASNLWLLWALAAGLAGVAARASLPTFLAVLAFCLGSSFAYATLAEYRPDMALGLATAAMAGLLASAALDARPARARGAGLFLGLALLVKPTFFAHTLVIAGAAAALSLAAARAAAPKSGNSLAGRDVAIFLGLGIALALPYYAIGGREILEYFWVNTFGSRGSLWNLDARLTPLETVRAFLPDLFGLARWHLVAAAIGAPVMAVALWRRGERREALRVAMPMVLALLSAAIIVAGRQPSPFFFATADALAILALVQGLVALDAGLAPRLRNAAYGLLALAVVVGVVLAPGSAGTATPDKAIVRAGASVNAALVDAIAADHRARGGGAAPEVFVGTAGLVNALTLRWVARERGFALAARESHVDRTLEEMERAAAAADYLVLLTAPGGDRFDKVPATLQATLLARARSRADLEILALAAPAPYAAFARRRPGPARIAPASPAEASAPIETR